MFVDDDFALPKNDLFGLGGLEALLGGPSLFDVGEVIITGRVPGALYVDDFHAGQTGLEYIQPLVWAERATNILSFDAVGLEGAPGLGRADELPPPESQDEEAPAGLVAANDDEAPAAQSLPSHGKDAEPLVLIPGEDDAQALVQPDLDAYDLAIPPLPSEVDLSMITVTPPGSVEADPVVIGGPAYQSLSFLILDTPFVVGDEHLPPTVRPSIEALLGLAGEDTWVLPLGGDGAWRLG
jgi:hypothetical protein